MGKAQGIFISYRRDTGSTMSRMIYDRLRFEKGYQCFLDVEKLHAGDFRRGIEKELAKCDIFILILSKNALNRCSDLKDNVRQEIETADRLGLTFIPVTSEDFVWPDVMPEGLEFVKDQNAIPYIQVYSESFFERLYAFIESQRREEPEDAGMQGSAGADPDGKQAPPAHAHSSDPGNEAGRKEKTAEAVPSGKPEKKIPIAVFAAGAAVAAVILIVFLFSGKKREPAGTTAAAETVTQTASGSGGTETAAGTGTGAAEETLAFIEDSEIMFDDILDLEIQENSMAAETAEEDTEEETAEEETAEKGTAEEGAEENNDGAEGSSEVQ